MKYNLEHSFPTYLSRRPVPNLMGDNSYARSSFQAPQASRHARLRRLQNEKVQNDRNESRLFLLLCTLERGGRGGGWGGVKSLFHPADNYYTKSMHVPKLCHEQGCSKELPGSFIPL